MQKDFIEGSPLLVKGGKVIVPNVTKTVEIARQRGILVIWVNTKSNSMPAFASLFIQSILHEVVLLICVVYINIAKILITCGH